MSVHVHIRYFQKSQIKDIITKVSMVLALLQLLLLTMRNVLLIEKKITFRTYLLFCYSLFDFNTLELQIVMLSHQRCQYLCCSLLIRCARISVGKPNANTHTNKYTLMKSGPTAHFHKSQTNEIMYFFFFYCSIRRISHKTIKCLKIKS